MIKIPLTNSEKMAIIDDDDYELVSNYSWYLKKSAYCNYVAASKRMGDKVITIRLHRLLMNPTGKLTVHHKEHNPLDNRRDKLQVCSNADNVRYNYEN